MTRTLKSSLESRLNQVISPTSNLMGHLISYAAMLLNYFNLDDTGKTPIQKVKGSTKVREIPEFGERALFQLSGENREKGTTQSNWEYGVFVGIVPRSDELKIARAGVIHQAWTVRRIPEAARWDGEKLLGDLETQGPTRLQVSMEPLAPIPDLIPRAEVVPDFAVRAKDIRAFGFTPGCKGCRALRLGGRQQAHDPECRRRIMDELRKIAEGSARIEVDEERQRVRREEMRDGKRQRVASGSGMEFGPGGSGSGRPMGSHHKGTGENLGSGDGGCPMGSPSHGPEGSEGRGGSMSSHQHDPAHPPPVQDPRPEDEGSEDPGSMDVEHPTSSRNTAGRGRDEHDDNRESDAKRRRYEYLTGYGEIDVPPTDGDDESKWRHEPDQFLSMDEMNYLSSGAYRDELTHEVLNGEEVERARSEELEYYNKMEVFIPAKKKGRQRVRKGCNSNQVG